MSSDIASIEEIVRCARRGRPYILVDAEDRENEGDLIIPGQFATAEWVNFMAREARGLICLALEPDAAQRLRLRPMAAENRSGHGTGFTISIEAARGVTTGISAHDRARTIAVAIDEACGPDDIVSPGHIFPLMARAGGVLVRAGHTEAAVDISRLAGLNPSGVICEIMNDDGSMARLPELVAFAHTHGFKVGTIADLIAYRRRHERSVESVLSMPFETVHGDFTMVVYRHLVDGAEHLVLTRGPISEDAPTLVRMHQVDLAADMLGHIEARQDYVARALQAIARYEGGGVAVFICDPDPASFSRRYASPGTQYRDNAIRDYGVGAQILRDLGVGQMILLTSSDLKLAALGGYGLSVLGARNLDGASLAE